jgi:hypothetical protein
MKRFDSSRQDKPIFFPCYTFVFFIQIFFSLLLLIFSPVHAATDTTSGSDPHLGWIKTFEQPVEGVKYSIIAVSDGGSVAIGNSKSLPGSSSLYIIKTDTNGNQVWEWTDAGSTYDGYSIIETRDKGYIVAGSSNTSITNGIFLRKLDPAGKTTWTQLFNKGEYYFGNYISPTRDGGFIVTGSVLRNNTSQSSLWDGYTLKTDAEGREQWTGFFKGEKNDFAKFIRQTEDGGYIIAGTTESFGITGVPSMYLHKMNEFGNKEWFITYGSGLGNEKLSVIQTPDGGYILMGTFLPVATNQVYKDLFVIRTDDRGKELWRKNISGMGRSTGNLLIPAAEGITVISGSYRESEREKTSEIIILDIDLNGNEKQNRTISIGKSIEIQDIDVIPGEGYFVTGKLTENGSLQKNGLVIIKILDNPSRSGVPVKNSFDLTIITKDAKTGTFIGGAHVYLDGRSIGSTSEQDGKQILRDVERGSHTIRVAKPGYEEITRPVDITEKKQITFTLNRSKVIPVQIHGSTDEKIDIVFVASKTSFNCNSKTKIQTVEYTGDQQRFITDVNNKVENVFLKLDTVTSGSVGLPKDFRERFNFYYYWDTEGFADAFEGCSGTLPNEFWSDAPFTDVAIIMYPSYEGFYSGPPCEPIGCANGLGPGSGSWLKAPADSPMIFLHESGHVVFGLIDTYCGDTYYVENSPFPNVWSSESSCKKNAEQERWNSTSCRQILKPASSRSKDPCVKNFWRADTDPDIMGSGAYSGRFGNASTSHIRHIFDTINRWQK